MRSRGSGADSRYISGIVTTRYWGSRYSLLGTRYLNRYSVTEATAVLKLLTRSALGSAGVAQQFAKSIAIGPIRRIFIENMQGRTV